MDSCNFEALRRQFEAMGARLKVSRGEGVPRGRVYDMDIIESRRQGHEIFSLSCAEAAVVDCLVLDLDRRDRHLLLMIKQQHGDKIEKHRYLCGHDERSWFVAAVPSSGGAVRNVEQAKESLKPRAAAEAQWYARVRRKNLHKRHNRGFLRQGEWFFIPAPDLEVEERVVLRNEPISRGRGKPHRVELIYRWGGKTVYVSRRHPGGVSRETYRRLLRQDPRMKAADWRVMTRDPEVYGRGRVTHPDHATLRLRGWHKILPNTEDRAPWISNLTFLD